MNEPRLTSITVGSDKDSRPIAVCERKGTNPGLFWLGGFKSDMKGTKAEALDRWAEKKAAPVYGLIIPATESQAARSLRERLAGGSRKVWRSICTLHAGRSWSSGRQWEVGWHCCWPEPWGLTTSRRQLRAWC